MGMSLQNLIQQSPPSIAPTPSMPSQPTPRFNQSGINLNSVNQGAMRQTGINQGPNQGMGPGMNQNVNLSMGHNMNQNMGPSVNLGMSQVMGQGINQGMNQANSMGMNQRLNQGLAPGMAQGIGQGINKSLNQGLLPESQGMNQGINLGLPQGMNHGMNQGMGHGMNQGMNQMSPGINQGLNQMNPGINQGMNQGLNQNASPVVNPGINQGMNQGVNRMNQGISQGMNRAVSQDPKQSFMAQGQMNSNFNKPFTPQQMQLLKLQTQAVKLLFKNPGQGGFAPIPRNLIDMATSDFPPENAQGAPPSSTRLPNQQIVTPQIPGKSPSVPFQQVKTPTNPMHTNQTPLQAALPQSETPLQTVMTPQEKPDLKKAVAKRLSKSKSNPATPNAGQQEEFSGILPVTLPAKPPVEFSAFTDGLDTSKKLVVPISKPNVQVDTFSLPTITDGERKQVPFSGLYASQSKIRIPAILPTSFDVDGIVNTRESLILLEINRRIAQLKKQLEAASNEDDKREIEAEIAQLELLPYQKEVRGLILSQVWFSKSLLPNSHPNFLAKFADLSVENVIATEELYKQQLNSIVQAQNRKHQDTVRTILSFNSRKREGLNSRKEKLERLSIKINSFHSQTAKEEQKKLEKMAKQRLQALRLNDEEAYLKLLDHTKDTRITHLLNQTNTFLDSLSQAVQNQQRESQRKAHNGSQEADYEEPSEEGKKEKIDYYQIAHRIKEEITVQPSILVGGTLKEYQLKGLQWMVSLFNNHLNGILADEMGLGKTIQTISLITYLTESKRIAGPFLVIVPLSTLTNWNLEFEKWAPSLKKITYKGTPVQRKVMQNDIRQQNFQVLLTTFEYVIKDKSLLSKIKWVHMIIDEGHRMKNTNSKLSETLTHHYHSDYRLILTGTPLQNNLPELWALLNFVLPKIFNSVKSFDEWFNTPFASNGGQDKIELSEEETLLIIRRLHKVLRPFLLRRLKKDVEKDLPNKVEKVLKCQMSALQSKLYSMMLKYNALFTGSGVGQKPNTIKNANNQLMQLRKICNHPFVYEEVENLINPKSETNDSIWRVAGKFELLDRILPKFKKTGHRVLLFFQMTQIMDIMEDFLRLRGMKYMRLDGGTKADDRTLLLKLFNEPNSDYFCFLLSTRAGGLGLNLQTADTVIIFDSDWNPHQDLQAQDRAHRIGQKNEVRILRLITEDSIEEMILERAVAKLEIDGKVIQAGKFDNKSTSEEQEAMLRALMDREEERRLKNEDEDDNLDDDELNQIIARNEAEIEIFRELDNERALETRNATYNARLYTEQELPEVYRTDPEIYRKTDEQLIEEYGRGNRERKTAVYDDNLTEEEWLKKIEGVVSEGSDVESGTRKKGRPRRKDLLDSDGVKRKREGDEDSTGKRARSSTPGSRGKGRPKVGRPKLKTSTNRNTPTLDYLSPEERLQLQNNMDIIYGNLLDYKESSRKLSDMFMVKPSKRLYPDYYVLIKHPLALDAVKKRIGNKTYTNIREFLEDIHLIFSNARIYNEEGSLVYTDAATLEDLAIQNFRSLYSSMDEEEKEKILDFKEFDEIHLLKPLVGGTSVKQPLNIAVANSIENEVDINAFIDAEDFEDDLPF